MKYEMQQRKLENIADIRIIGVGGGGNKVVNRMIETGLKGVGFYAVNTESRAVRESLADNRIQIGKNITDGLGAGSDPEIGRRAAEESIDELKKISEGADLVFITAGMGGGTGTGAAPVIASLAKDQDVLTVAVVSRPFLFEGMVRQQNADAGIRLLKDRTDAILVISNENLLKLADRNTSLLDAFKLADEVLSDCVRGISDLLVTTAMINLDYADVRTILRDGGMCHMGIGIGTGEERVKKAVEKAISSPLLETSISGATGVILSVTGPEDLTMFEVEQAAGIVKEKVDSDANIIFGADIDSSLDDSVKITVIATGFNMDNETLEVIETHKTEEKSDNWEENFFFDVSGLFKPR